MMNSIGLCRGVSLAVVGCVALEGASAQALRFSATPLDFPAGFVPRAMNGSRTIAGFVGSYEDGSEAATWSGGVLTRLGSTGVRYAGLNAINEQGDAAGSRSDGGWEQPIRYVGGVLEPLPATPDREWVPMGINDAGVICGFGTNAAALPEAMLWVDGKPVALAPYELAKAKAINNRGDVAGDRLIQLQAVVWRADGTLLELERGDQLWQPRFINDDGLVAGDNGVNPVLWDSQGHAQEIIIPGRQFARVEGLDALGRVFGDVLRPQMSGQDSWVFDGSQAHLLADLVDGAWGGITRVWAVNRLGEAIVSSETGEFLLLTPVPTPASSVGLSIGAFAAAARRRRRAAP